MRSSVICCTHRNSFYFVSFFFCVCVWGFHCNQRNNCRVICQVFICLAVCDVLLRRRLPGQRNITALYRTFEQSHEDRCTISLWLFVMFSRENVSSFFSRSSVIIRDGGLILVKFHFSTFLSLFFKKKNYRRTPFLMSAIGRSFPLWNFVTWIACCHLASSYFTFAHLWSNNNK